MFSTCECTLKFVELQIKIVDLIKLTFGNNINFKTTQFLLFDHVMTIFSYFHSNIWVSPTQYPSMPVEASERLKLQILNVILAKIGEKNCES